MYPELIHQRPLLQSIGTSGTVNGFFMRIYAAMNNFHFQNSPDLVIVGHV